jgi:hypothetical protein
MRPVRPLRSRLTLVLSRCVCEARAYLNTSSAAVCTRRLSVLADAVVAAASREIQASPLRPSSRSLGTTSSSAQRHFAGDCFVPNCERVRVNGGASPRVLQGRHVGARRTPCFRPTRGYSGRTRPETRKARNAGASSWPHRALSCVRSEAKPRALPPGPSAAAVGLRQRQAESSAVNCRRVVTARTRYRYLVQFAACSNRPTSSFSLRS